jgi:hypothetical protein
MGPFIKLIALGIVAVLLTPVLGANTEVGRVVGAALEDAGAFCERRPEACHQTAEIVRETRAAVLAALGSLGEEPRPHALTEEDRALAPPDLASQEPFDAIGAHDPARAP